MQTPIADTALANANEVGVEPCVAIVPVQRIVALVARAAGSGCVSNAYLGNRLDPITNSSTARAAWRPSRMAHTTRLWPRRMSPAANTLGTLVA
jgi:hypothetical protein